MPKRKYQPAETFIHRRLNSPRSFRLLSLAASSDLSSQLMCDVFITSFDDNGTGRPKYEALSYVWGSPTGTIPFSCDSKELLITPNCDEALRYLRLSDRSRTLWIDAICIDQGDSEESVLERNNQITLMGEIYRNAERTLCWLGKGQIYTAGLFQLLRRVGDCSSKRELQKLIRYDEQLQREGKLETGATCLNHLYCHVWHSRVWTLQEVAFSQDCQIMCGKEVMSWESYVRGAKFFIYEEFIDELDATAWTSYLGIEIRNDLRDSILSFPTTKDNKKTIPLLTSGLTQVRHLQASNPKDKIYGLYATFAALGIPLPAPVYKKSLARIYEEACVAIIFVSRSLKMLEYACSNGRSAYLPSWVPDWQDENATLLNLPSEATEGSLISQTTMSALSPASGHLLVRGKIIGSITSRSENDFSTLEFPSGSLPILKDNHYDLVGIEVDSLRLLVHRVKTFREWIRLLDGIPTLCYDDEESYNFLHKLVTFDSKAVETSAFNAWVDILHYPATKYDLGNGQKLAEAWKKTDTECSNNWTQELFQCAVIAATLAGQSATVAGQATAEVVKLMDVTAHISGNMGSRTLVLVHDNLLDSTLPGTAFHKANVSDSIVLLEGADFPVVLRRKGDQWDFVGTAYVAGVTDGEAWPDEEDALRDLQEFTII